MRWSTPMIPNSRPRPREGIPHSASEQTNEAIPDKQSILTSAAQSGGANHTHRFRNAVNPLTDRRSLTDEKRRELGTHGSAPFAW